MRALKTILIIVGAVVGILLVLGMFKEPHFRVERTTVINAPVGAVYANVSSLANMEKVGPAEGDGAQHDLPDVGLSGWSGRRHQPLEER